MKKRVISIVCISIMLCLTACGSKPKPGDVQIDESIAGEEPENENTDGIQEDNKPEAAAKKMVNSDETFLLNGTDEIYLVKDGNINKIFNRREDEGYYISSSVLTDDRIYVLVRDYSSGYEFIEYDLDGKELNKLGFSDEKSVDDMAEYQGVIYIVKSYYDEGDWSHLNYEIYSLNKQTFEFELNDKYTAIAQNISWGNNMVYSGAKSIFGMANMFFDGNLYMKNEYTGELGVYDMEGEQRYSLNFPKEGYVEFASGKYMVIRADVEDNENIFNYSEREVSLQLYNLETADCYEIFRGQAKDCWNILAIENDNIIYDKSSNATYGINENTLYRFDIPGDGSLVLYSRKDTPGCRGYYVSPGLTGFTLADNKLFFQDIVGNDVVWSYYDLATKETINTDCKIYTYDKSFGDVTYVSKTYTDQDTGKVYYRYYVESFKFNDSVKNADKINAVLQKRDKEFFEYVEETKERTAEEFNPEYAYESTEERTVGDISRLGDKYIQIEFNSYSYMGGAHGYPGYEINLFDTETGEEVTIDKLYKGSEEQYRTLVADSARNEALINNQGFYDQYTNGTDGAMILWNEVYETMDFSRRVKFYEDRIEVIFDPYEYGPYASGYISVPVSYSSLGVTL